MCVTTSYNFCLLVNTIKIRHAKVLLCGAPNTSETTFAHWFKRSRNSSINAPKVIFTKEGEWVSQSKINELMETDATTDGEDDIWDVLTLQNINCEPELINLLPDLNDSTAVSFILLNVSKGENCLDELVPGKKNFRKHNHKCTIKYLLKRLLASIKEFSTKKCTSETSKSNDSKPIVCFLGIFYDQSDDKDSCPFLKNLEYKFEKWRDIINSDESLYFCGYGKIACIPINKDTGLEETIEQQLYSKVIETLKSKDPDEIPLAWALLESHLRKEKKISLSLEEIEDTWEKIIPSQNREKELLKFLKFYHSFGTLLYFNEPGLNKHVIINPRLLCENINKLVTCEAVKGTVHDMTPYDRLNEGILHEALLKEIGLIDQGIDLGYFIKLLEYLKICSCTYEDQLFMPIVLPPFSGSGENIFKKMKLCDSSEAPLIIKFDINIIPRGMFCLLVTQLKKEQPDWKLPKNDPHVPHYYQHSNLAIFSIDDGNHCFSLLDKVFYLEIRISKSSPSYMKVQEAVTNSLRSNKQKFGFQFDEIRYGFLCSEHHRFEHSDQNPSTKHFCFLPKCMEIEDGITVECDKGHKMTLEKKHTTWFKVAIYTRIHNIHCA